MQISQRMNDELNQQITNEKYSSNLYLAMAAAFETMNLKVYAKCYYKQAEEETLHGMKIFRYIVDAGGRVMVNEIPQLPKENLVALVRAARDHQIKVNDAISDLVALAEAENDYATGSFLAWLVDDQAEEAADVKELVSLVKMAGTQVLYMEHHVAPIS